MAKLKIQTQAPAPEVDFESALHPAQGNDLQPDYPVKRGRGRPKGSVTKKPKAVAAQHGTPHQPPNSDNINNINKGIDSKSNNDCSELLSKQIDIDIKAEFTEKELKFLKLYLLGDVTQEMAMIYAGYKATQPRYVRFLAKKIIQKYESQGGDHQKIFREIGFGEVEIAMGIKNLAQNAKSEMVRLNALALAAKCLGLTKEQLEGAGGITIIFEGPEAQVPGPGAPPALSGGEPRPAAGLPGPLRPLQITR